MKKILFADIKDYDINFLNGNKITDYEYIFKKEPFENINLTTYSDVEILSVFTSSSVRADKLKQLPNLKYITTRSTGFSNIDLEYCNQNNISVSNVPRYGDFTVAEFTFGLLLNVSRKITIAYDDLKKGEIDIPSGMGVDLFGKTLGVIGTGKIGANVIKIAKGFSMKILAYDLYPNDNLVKKYDVKYTSLDELYQQSDFITIHAPSTKTNHHMINEKAFDKMKSGVILVNTARGEIVDTIALYKALQSKKVAAAGLDVLECENAIMSDDFNIDKADCLRPDCLHRTLINNNLLKLPNVIVTPHLAFNTIEALDRIHKTTLSNIEHFSKENILNKVN